jgi:hypothetical protein
VCVCVCVVVVVVRRYVAPLVPIPKTPKPVRPLKILRAVYALASDEELVFHDVTQQVQGMVEYDAGSNTDILSFSGKHHVDLNMDPWSGQVKKLKVWYQDPATNDKKELFLLDGDERRLTVPRA